MVTEQEREACRQVSSILSGKRSADTASTLAQTWLKMTIWILSDDIMALPTASQRMEALDLISKQSPEFFDDVSAVVNARIKQGK